MSRKDIAQVLADEGEAAERTDLPAGARPTRIGAKRSSVFTLRLSTEELAALQVAAADAGLPPSTLARKWILDGLVTDPPEDLRTIVHDEVVAAVREALAS